MLLFVGRIQPLKGADMAVPPCSSPALAATPTRCWWWSVAPAAPTARSTCRPARVWSSPAGLGEKVRFVAPQPHDLLSTYYRAADVCLVPAAPSPSGWWRSRRPRAAPRWSPPAVGGLTTLVDDGRTGFLVDGHDVDGFAAASGEAPRRPVPGGSHRRERRRSAPELHLGGAASLLHSTYEELAAERLVGCG